MRVRVRAKDNRRERDDVPGVPSHRESTAPAAGAISGAASGAAIGSFAGPPGAIAGAILGGAAGAAAGAALERSNERRSFHDRELDEAIGVTSGEIGAPNLEHPPAIVGAYSRPSSGGGGTQDDEEVPDSGPIPKVK
jgi:hypothetical protein